ncbi:transketolase [Harryflintia acetispora]|uniref:Transketolase n=1 Tax=Harryflintia acetispora TaxID=1849041 RepID=A0A9X8ULW2_9FIRM|nr:transketolase [Harryflintia acetispora]TCL45511.1 transketolase [Harryflintia acetispora]
MTQQETRALQIAATKIRLGVIEGVYHAKSGHPGGALSSSDILAYLYFQEMRIDPQNPEWEDRDRFVLSKGHAAPGLYAALANRGYFPVEELGTLRHIGSRLQGHPDMKGIPGVDMSTGSLGQGVSAACGMAKAAKLMGKDYRVYALLGDGEIQEGQVWEAAMFAGHQKLDNLCLIVDNNGLQIDGNIEDICSPYPIDEKFAAFGFATINIDAHDYGQIADALAQARQTKDGPTAIIAKSTKGKGVSFMEGQASWHGTAPNEEQYRQAMGELQKLLEAYEGGR